MAENTRSLSEGAGATTTSSTGGSSTGGGSTTSGTSTSTGFSSSTGSSGQSYSGGSYGSQDRYEGSETTGRSLILTEQRDRSRPSTAVVVGAAVAGAIAGGAIPFMFAGRSSSGSSRSETAQASESVTVNRPAQELYSFWRDFTNFPQFMDNIRSVTKLDERRSHWVIEAPAGASVEFDSYITEEVPGRLIAWRSEEGTSVPNRGRVEFIEQGDGRSTTVRATISYDPPGGAAGRYVAKLFGREPQVQARQDLNRFKSLMEGRSGS